MIEIEHFMVSFAQQAMYLELTGKAAKLLMENTYLKQVGDISFLIIVFDL